MTCVLLTTFAVIVIAEVSLATLIGGFKEAAKKKGFVLLLFFFFSFFLCCLCGFVLAELKPRQPGIEHSMDHLVVVDNDGAVFQRHPRFTEVVWLFVFALRNAGFLRGGFRLPVLSQAPLLKLSPGFFWGRHSAVDDHALGETDGCLNVSVLSDDVFGMGQAHAASILDTPLLPRR